MNGTASAIAKRYADGFLEYAGETIGFEEGIEELRIIKEILRDNPDFKAFLQSPEIKYSEKSDFIEKVLYKEGLSQEGCNFLKLLLKKSRIDEFPNIEKYARIKYSHGKEVEALLKTSYILDTTLMQKIKESLENKLKKKLHLYIEIDPSLLGGVSVTIGNTIIDGSAKRRLEDIREKLMKARVN